MFNWLKSLFHKSDDLVEKIKVLDFPNNDGPYILLDSIEYDEMIAQNLSQLIGSAKLPEYLHLKKFINLKLRVDKDYLSPFKVYRCKDDNYSADLKKLSVRWKVNQYFLKCQCKEFNTLMLEVIPSSSSNSES